MEYSLETWTIYGEVYICVVRNMNGILGSDAVVTDQRIENDKTVGANKRISVLPLILVNSFRLTIHYPYF